MSYSPRHRTVATVVVVAALILFYPVVGNVLLFSGSMQNLISAKPEKLTVQWQRAWTFFPGRLYVEGLDLDIKSKRHRIGIKVQKGILDLSLLKLIRRTVDIKHAHGEGIRIQHARRSQVDTPNPTDTRKKADARTHNAAMPASSENQHIQVTAEDGPPWTVHLRDISASDVQAIRLDELSLQGRGELKNLSMQMVTRGGPVRVDDVSLEMTARPPPDQGNPEGELTIEADLAIAEFLPRQNRGKKLLQYVSGRIGMVGEVQNLGHIDVILGKRYNLGISGAGHIDLKLQLDKGQVKKGSRIDFRSEDFQTDFLEFRAAGQGRVSGKVRPDPETPVVLQIELDHFNLRRPDDPLPYLQGQSLSVEFHTDQLLLHQRKLREKSRLSFNIQDAVISDLTHYNRYLPQQTGVKILSGTGQFKGGMTIKSNKAHGTMQIAGSEIVLAVRGRKIHTDLELAANLSDGDYDARSYRLKDTHLRLFNTRLETSARETEDDWWAEIRVNRGKLLWSSPMDVDAQLSLSMRDLEPLIAAVRDPAKKVSVLEKALNVKSLHGVLAMETNLEQIALDPILINGEGLEVVSRLDIVPNAINGVLYAKLHGLSANFEITDSKARFRGFGGREKVLKQVKPMTGDL